MDKLFNSLSNEPFSIKNIRLFSDGGGSGDDPGTDDKGADDAGKDTGGNKKDDKGAADTGDQGTKDTGKSFDEKYVKELREEAAKYRTERKELADKAEKLELQFKSIQKAMGLDDGEPDADKLQAELKAKEAELRSLKIESVFNKVARKEGADEDLTYAVLHRKGALTALEMDDKLEASLAELVKQAIEDNPKLKAGETSSSSTGDTKQGGEVTSKGGFNEAFRAAVFGSKK